MFKTKASKTGRKNRQIHDLVGEFNSPFSAIDRITKHIIGKDI